MLNVSRIVRLTAILGILTVRSPAAYSQSASVRLQVHVESWLENTSLDVYSAIADRLAEAGIRVTDRSDAPFAEFTYTESPARGLSPRLVPATAIRLSLTMNNRGVQTFLTKRPIKANLQIDPRTFPSAYELRELAIEAFRKDPMFVMSGHLVGANLGLEASFRHLLADGADEFTKGYAERTVFRTLAWSPQNDDIFEKALHGLEGRPTALPAVEAFLKSQLLAMRGATAPAWGSTLAAIRLLGRHGEVSAIEVLQLIAKADVNPAILVAADGAIADITARLQ